MTTNVSYFLFIFKHCRAGLVHQLSNPPLKNLKTMFQVSTHDLVFYHFSMGLITFRKLGSVATKGQKKSKLFFQIDVSSKKRTDEFYFTAMKPQGDLFLFRFLEEIEGTKKTF